MVLEGQELEAIMLVGSVIGVIVGAIAWVVSLNNKVKEIPTENKIKEIIIEVVDVQQQRIITLEQEVRELKQDFKVINSSFLDMTQKIYGQLNALSLNITDRGNK